MIILQKAFNVFFKITHPLGKTTMFDWCIIQNGLNGPPLAGGRLNDSLLITRWNVRREDNQS
jgi:hypothetical protein